MDSEWAGNKEGQRHSTLRYSRHQIHGKIPQQGKNECQTLLHNYVDAHYFVIQRQIQTSFLGWSLLSLSLICHLIHLMPLLGVQWCMFRI